MSPNFEKQANLSAKMQSEPAKFVQLLASSGINFIVVGGWAAIIHGSARTTQDFDVVYERSRTNIEKLASALAALHPYLRGAPPGLPFKWDLATIRNGLNFTLTTDLGDFDLLGEIAGGGAYYDLLPNSVEVAVFQTRCRCLNLDQLIQTKRAAGRPKDLEVVAELELLRGRSSRGN